MIFRVPQNNSDDDNKLLTNLWAKRRRVEENEWENPLSFAAKE